MKKILLLLIIHSTLYIVNCYSQQYGWVALTSPTTGTLRRIYVSGNEAWLNSGNNIYYSNNYPTNLFTAIYTPVNALYDMIFIKQDGNKYGWAVGTSSLGARTTDGTNWISMSLGGTSSYYCVSFPTTNLGFASGTDKRLHKTVNGGIDWNDAGVALGFSTVITIFFVDSNIGYVATADPRLAKTKDGGVTWVDEGDITGGINDICFYDSTLGWAVGDAEILYHNSGVWTRLNNPTGNSLNSVFFINTGEGWIVGNGGTILHSTDGGANWTAQSSGTSANLLDVFFTSSTNGYAVGTNGTILHYTLLTDVEEQPMQPTEFKLEQNYPNPFNPSTKIKFTIPTPPSSSPLAKGRNEVGFVTLKVYDILGNEITTLVNEEKPAGVYNVEFGGKSSTLSSGIYFYKLTAGDYVATKKMILIK